MGKLHSVTHTYTSYCMNRVSIFLKSAFNPRTPSSKTVFARFHESGSKKSEKSDYDKKQFYISSRRSSSRV